MAIHGRLGRLVVVRHHGDRRAVGPCRPIVGELSVDVQRVGAGLDDLGRAAVVDRQSYDLDAREAVGDVEQQTRGRTR